MTAAPPLSSWWEHLRKQHVYSIAPGALHTPGSRFHLPRDICEVRMGDSTCGLGTSKARWKQQKEVSDGQEVEYREPLDELAGQGALIEQLQSK